MCPCGQLWGAAAPPQTKVRMLKALGSEDADALRPPSITGQKTGMFRKEKNVMTKAKIVIATYQIACSIPWSLPQVRFPAIFEEALKLGSIVNLSFISFAKAECFGDFDYFDKLLFVTLLPVVFVIPRL